MKPMLSPPLAPLPTPCRLDEPQPPPQAPPSSMESVLHSAADYVADAIVTGLWRPWQAEHRFDVEDLLLRALKGLTEAQRQEIRSYGLPNALQERLSALIHFALSSRGRSAAAIRFAPRPSPDGKLELKVQGVKVGGESSWREYARLNSDVAYQEAQQRTTSQLTLRTAAELLTKAAAEAMKLQAPSREETQEQVRRAIVALEKAARQLKQVQRTGVPQQSRDYRAMQRAYAKLLLSLSGHDPIDGRPGGEGMDTGPASIIQVLLTRLGVQGSSEDSVERRAQNALASLFESAPVPAAMTEKISDAEYAYTKLSWASSALLCDPVKAALLLRMSQKLAFADQAIEAGDDRRARGILRDVGAELNWSLGPELVTAQVLLMLGDLEAGVGADARAYQAYVGALRVVVRHLPPEHILVREVAGKVRQSGEAWLASLSASPRPQRHLDTVMPDAARSARLEVERTEEELGIVAILGSNTPAITTPPGAGSRAFAEGLRRARPGSGELHQVPSDLHVQLDHALFGYWRESYRGLLR